MNLAKIYSTQFDVLNSFIVEVEVDVVKGAGTPNLKIVGLPDKAVEEARERVVTSLKNSNFGEPQADKIIVSLSPAEEKKTGPIFDLTIALGYILADEQVIFNPEKKIFLGELALDGSLRKISGVLPMVKLAKEKGFTSVYLPKENADEAALISGINIFPVESLKQIVDHLRQEIAVERNLKKIISPHKNNPPGVGCLKNEVDFSDIKGQEISKRALEIAAAGGHNVMMYGPPGTGKTMMARAFTGILPDLSEKQALEITSIHSAAGALKDEVYISKPPFRSPHHTSSYVSIIGGGTYPKPGEATLAHGGVLFMDEFIEFDKRVLESLREPLEDGFVNISRAKGSLKFPADFILIAAMNPPSEVFRSKSVSYAEEQKFRKKLSGPIMDRIDLWTEVSKIDHKDLTDKKNQGEKSQEIKKRVLKAREIQKKRFGGEKLNSQMSARDIQNLIDLKPEVKKILEDAALAMDFSPRVFHKMIKLSRTVADLDESENIEEKHILEALQYRPKEIL